MLGSSREMLAERKVETGSPIVQLEEHKPTPQSVPAPESPVENGGLLRKPSPVLNTKSFPTSNVAERRIPPACFSEMRKPPPPMRETLMKAPPEGLVGPPLIHYVLEGIAFLGDTSVSNVEPHDLGYPILFKFCRTAYIAAFFDITVLGCFFAYIRSTAVSMRCTAWCFGNI